MRKFVFLVSGYGLGNATRCYATIQSIRDKDPNSEIHILTWGVAFDFFEKKKTELNSLSTLYAYRRIWAPNIPGFSFVLNLPYFFFVWVLNCRRIEKLLSSLKPDLLIHDSDYHFFPMRYPRVFLGQALDVVSVHWRSRFRFLSARSWVQFLFQEVGDVVVQYLFCKAVFVPSFESTRRTIAGSNFLRIPLVARKFGFQKDPSRDFCIIASGSRVDQEALSVIAKNLDVPLLVNRFGTAEEDQRFMNELLSARAWIFSGGLSTLSECISLRKMAYLVIGSHHPEHIANLIQAEKFKVGQLWTGRILNSPNQINSEVATNGAEVLAQKLIEMT